MTTLHRDDPGGPTADIECDDTTATATWLIPDGQLLDDHPELGTGGYAYFTLNETPTETLTHPSQHVDFSGSLVTDQIITIRAEVDPGVEYRAHLLLAYDTGETWHNDTIFVCEVPVEVSSTVVHRDELPFTGVDPLTAIIGALALIVGAVMVRLGGEK